VLVVAAGGLAGGLARYGAGLAWPSPAGAFPWPTWLVNTSGSFVLALTLVLVIDMLRPAYVRPLVGTGFCGAFTTFSSVVTTSDELAAHGHLGTAAAYLSGSLAGGLAAAAFGVIIGRSLAGQWQRRRG
jgi:CrcB protein